MVINPETGGLLLPLKADPAGGKKLRVLINGEMYRLKLNPFDYDMLFCLTFHKLQGMTLDRLVLDLRKPVYPPHHTHEMALVAASRVRQGAHVRALTPGWSHLCECKSDIRIRAWRTGFSDTGGVWNRARAIEEFNTLQANAPSAPKRRRVNKPSDSSGTVPPGNGPCAGGGADCRRKRVCVFIHSAPRSRTVRRW